MLFLIKVLNSAAAAGFGGTNEAFPLPTHQQGLEWGLESPNK